MRIAIDIPEDIYEASQFEDKDYIKMMSDEICTALSNGIIDLPPQEGEWEQYADRLYDLAYKSGALEVIKELEEMITSLNRFSVYNAGSHVADYLKLTDVVGTIDYQFEIYSNNKYGEKKDSEENKKI